LSFPSWNHHSIVSYFSRGLTQIALFTSVIRAIERESPRCHDAHRHQLLYVIGWFLRALFVNHSKTSKISDEVDFGNVASVFDPRCLVLVLRFMREASDNKNWTELHAAMECFEELVTLLEDITDES
jgi:replication fork protection complex subunit Tof1/Swi1